MRIAAFLLLASLTLPTTAHVDDHHPRVFDSVRPLSTIVLHDLTTNITLYRNICTVSSINTPLHLWLTAAHCILKTEMSEEGDGARITTPRSGLVIDGHPVYVVKMDESADLAILFTPVLSLPALRFADRAPLWEQRIRVVGYPFGFTAVTIAEGTIATPEQPFFDADFSPSYMLFTAQIAPGNSGSPVINTRGEIVSVAQIGWGRGYSSGGGSTYARLKAFAGEYFER